MRIQGNQLEENFLVQKTNFNRIRNILIITDLLIEESQESKIIIIPFFNCHVYVLLHVLIILSMNYCMY